MPERDSIAAEKDTSRCYVCGPENAAGLRVPFVRDGTNGSSAIYVASADHAGWNGVLHGGITFALMDEACGWSLFFQDISAVTARVETRFHKAIRVGTEVTVRAVALPRRRRLYDAHAEIRTNDAASILLAEANAVMFELSAEKRISI